MENATKAMLIAAGVLIGVMILSFGAVLFSELEAYVESSHERMKFNEQNAFNSQFTKYADISSTIQDVVTAANIAYQNNVDYHATEDERGNDSTLYVAVYLEGTPIENTINEMDDATENNNAVNLLSKNIDKKYRCEIEISQETGRVNELYFWPE